MIDFYSKEQLSKQLGISIRTLGRWHSLRKGPARTKCGNFIGYRIEAVEAWLKQNETAPVVGGKYNV